MSSRCMAAVFERYPAGGGEFALALALADNAHDDGTHIFPGMDLMAHKSRQDVRSVKRHLKTMLASGWLMLVRPGARGRSNEYRISPRWLRGDSLSPQSEPLDPGRGDNLSSHSMQWGDKLSCHSESNGVTNDAPSIRTDRTTIPPQPPQGGAAPGEVTTPKAGEGAGFEAIAAEYPRRARLQAARKVWDIIDPDAELQACMLSAIKAWRRSPEWQREDGRYVPRLDRWLLDRRWLDAPGSAVAAPPPAPIERVELTQEQLKANGERARQAAAHARAVLSRAGVPA